jgi:hypothetical protein
MGPSLDRNWKVLSSGSITQLINKKNLTFRVDDIDNGFHYHYRRHMRGPGKWQHRLHGHGARWTAPRSAILELLSRSSKHMSAKDVYGSLNRTHPGLGLTTVYRTLDLLVRMGLLNKL